MQLLTQDDLAELKQRYTNPNFADAITHLRAIATHEMTHPLNIPTEGAGWTHNYTCPTHATRLIFDRDKPHEHVCAIDGEVFSGGLYDEAWRGFRNNTLIKSAYAAAIIYAMSGEEDYRNHTLEVLSTYAKNYSDYPVHGINAGQGRVMGQSLDEAVWAISAAWSYDLIRDSLTTDEANLIENELLRGLGNHLLTQLWQLIHNIQCWHLAGLATVGVVLDEEKYIAPTFHEKWGINAQIQNGAMNDGWWWEGSPHYHFYTLRAMTSLGVALRYRHPELLNNARWQKMFTAPLEILRADFSLPSFNDGWYDCTETGGIAQYVEVYEKATAFWNDPLYLNAMAHIYTHYAKRDGLDALLFGADKLPKPEPMPAKSLIHADSGYAILKSSDNQKQLILKYGPHGGGHGHPDKLAITLWANGQRLSPDLGTPGYGISMNNSWYRHTLSHNTALIDHAVQPSLTGELVHFEIGEHFTLVAALAHFPENADEPYNDVTLRRVVLWKDAYMIDVMQIECSEARTIDFAWHHTGTLAMDGLSATDMNFEQSGYAHLTNIRTTDAQQWNAIWNNPNTAMWAYNPANTTTLVTDAPGNPTSEVMSLILRRAEGQHATFVSVIDTFADEQAIKKVEWTPSDNGIQVTVMGEGIQDTWALDTKNAIYRLS